jgi:ribonuclease D
LRELWALRETYAIKLDRPPFRILHDERLIELSERLPQTSADLERLPGLPRPWRQGSRARELLAAVRRALALDPDEWPARVKGRRGRSNPKLPDERVAGIKQHRDRVAGQLGLEPALLGPRSVLEQIIERIEAGGDPRATPDLRRWQWNLLAPAIEDKRG